MIYIQFRPDLSYYAYFPKKMRYIERNRYRVWHSPMIVYPDYHKQGDTKKSHLLTMLHEMGHHYFKHGMIPYDMPVHEEARIETQAWCYAFECVKSQYFQDVLVEALKFLSWTFGQEIGKICKAQLQDYINNLNPGG